MQQVASGNRTVLVRALRPFQHGGQFLELGAEVTIDYIHARGLEHAGKATIVADPAPEPASAPAASEADKAKAGAKKGGDRA